MGSSGQGWREGSLFSAASSEELRVRVEEQRPGRMDVLVLPVSQMPAGNPLLSEVGLPAAGVLTGD